MESIIAWLFTTDFGPYLVAFFGAVGALVTAASFIVPLTKTPKDDEILDKVKAFLSRFSVFYHKDAK